MKKLTLLVFYRDKENITQQLEKLGAVHIELKEEIENDTTLHLENKKQAFQKAIEILASQKNGNTHKQLTSGNTDRGTPAAKKFGKDPVHIKENIIALRKETEHLKNQGEQLLKEQKLLAPWGDFNIQNIQKLKKHGIETLFFSAPQKSFKDYDFKNLTYAVINRTDNMVYFVIFSKNVELPEIPFERVKLPEKALKETQKEISNNQEKVAKKETTLGDLYVYEELLKEAMTKTAFEKLREQVNLSYKDYAQGKILQLNGWFPQTVESEIRNFLETQKLAFSIQKPEHGDKVPILLKNKSYPKLFEPITRLFQLPHYHEMDLTPFIAVFYPIFFAYCLGDSGYGFILLLASIISWFTLFKNAKNFAILGIVLGALTMLMGTIKSGSFFGLSLLENQDIPFFNFLSQYVFIPDDQSFVFNAFNVAIMIGLFQILFAVIISAIKNWYYHSIIHTLQPIGKFLIIVGAVVYFLGGMQQSEFFIPWIGAAKIMLWSGIIIIVFFHDMSIPLFKRSTGSLLPLFFIFTNLLGDTLSYVRLFALGVSSSVLGLVVNQIGIGMMGGVVGTIVAVIFLIFGHTLNFLLAALGASVHPLRLTFVEFYNNAKFEGGGEDFQAFKKPETI
ncbi:MAG: V-type ATPase 116kDa subunit family protein [Bacteroidota bacterium]